MGDWMHLLKGLIVIRGDRQLRCFITMIFSGSWIDHWMSTWVFRSLCAHGFLLVEVLLNLSDCFNCDIFTSFIAYQPFNYDLIFQFDFQCLVQNFSHISNCIALLSIQMLQFGCILRFFRSRGWKLWYGCFLLVLSSFMTYCVLQFPIFF